MYPRPRFEGFEVQIYFLASKILGFFVVPSNFIPALLICGLLLWCTRYARAGQRLCVASILLLLLVSGLPVGTALLLPLENRFPPWDPSHSAPTGIIVLGGAISPEISVRRREVSLNSAAERLYAVLELIFATRSHRLFRWQRERFVPRAI